MWGFILLTKNTGEEKTLIIDPIGNMGHVIRGILASLNFAPGFVATNIYRGTQILRTEKIKIIFCDAATTPYNGLAYAKAIRQASDSKFRDVPFILTSVEPTPEMIKAARDVGINHVLGKPCSISAVEARLRQIFERDIPFIETASYVGPDRRRRDRKIDLPDRRNPNTAILPPNYGTPLNELLRPPEKKAKAVSGEQPGKDERLIRLANLREGMYFTRDCLTRGGLMIIAKKQPLSAKAIGRIRDLVAAKKLEDAFYIPKISED